MLEEQQPLLFKGPIQHPSFRLQSLDGKEIVAHDVGERQMRHRRDQVAKEEGDLAFRFDLDALMPARVAGGDDGGHTWNEFRIAMQKFPLIDVSDRGEIVPAIAGSGPFIDPNSIFKLTLLNQIARFGNADRILPSASLVVFPPAWSKCR